MLRFCFGPSGSGKSKFLYEETIKKSLEDKTAQFLIVVPDQYTLQVQRRIVRMHPARGIMNIDVLSFSRLVHRVFDEVGAPITPVLDDMGKTLILRHTAERIKGELPLIAKRMRQPGFMDEIKSLISECLQYGVGPDELEILIEACGRRGGLKARLKDLKQIFCAFEDDINGRYITSEGTMGELARRIPGSSLIKDSFVVFDGFTGFTPIQYQVLLSIMETAASVTVSLVLDDGEDPWSGDEGSLFLLSRKAAADLEHTAFLAESRKMDDSGRPVVSDTSPEAELRFAQRRRKIAGDIYISGRPVKRLEKNPGLAFLEQNLFRETEAVFPEKEESGSPGSIVLRESPDVSGECRDCCIEIRKRLSEDKSLKYGDFAVLCTDPASYTPALKKAAEHYKIPMFIDETGDIGVDPLVELMESAVETVRTGYSPEAVFRFMRCPLSGFDRMMTDRLELYVRALGIRGRRRWNEKFIRTVWTDRPETEQAKLLDSVNAMRERLTGLMDPLFEASGKNVREMSTALIELFDSLGVQPALREMSKVREACGDTAGHREFSQIYRKIVGLMDQMVALLSDERVSLREYLDLLKVGINKISIGMIPGSADRVTVGDLERTRLGEVRVLILLGANDSLLPASPDGGGYLSELDRRFLREAQDTVRLSPDPGEKLRYGRQYIYMNVTVPTDALILSWSRMGGNGTPMRPADLVMRIRRMFPDIAVGMSGQDDGLSGVWTARNAESAVAAAIREYAGGELDSERGERFLALVSALSDTGNAEYLNRIAGAAYYKYQPLSIKTSTAVSLYGRDIENSVSRLEMFAGCPFEHFARYGLRLREDERYEVGAVDLGMLYHESLEGFDRELAVRGLDWRTIKEEEARSLIGEILTGKAAGYRNDLFLSNSRYRQMLSRVERILQRSVDTLQYQIKKGEFSPASVEWDFRSAGRMPETVIPLDDGTGGRILLHGRIDRVDVCDTPDARLFRVIDLKSGNRTMDPALIYHGIELQLMLYMRVYSAALKRRDDGMRVTPAGVFYYKVDDPVITGSDNKITDDITQQIRKKLALTGIANSDEEILLRMDRDLGPGQTSDVLPVGYNRNGTLKAASHVYSTEDLNTVSEHVGRKIVELAKRIHCGEIGISPYAYGKKSACVFCAYRGVCGFDVRLPGYGYRTIAGMSEADALQRMRAAGEIPDNGK